MTHPKPLGTLTTFRGNSNLHLKFPYVAFENLLFQQSHGEGSNADVWKAEIIPPDSVSTACDCQQVTLRLFLEKACLVVHGQRAAVLFCL